MNEDKFKQLLKKLDYTLNADGSIPSVSPGIKTPDGASLRQGFYITPNINLESLSKNELLLTHTLLHKLYVTGCKSLTKEQIKEIHENVRNMIPHNSFDSLDE